MRCGMPKKCPLFMACPLRTFYEAVMKDNIWMDRYCKGKYEQCARYKLEVMEGRGLPGRSPDVRKKKARRKAGCKKKRKSAKS
jgi:hypothetical protein